MKGDPAILDLLNDLLTGELTAINQYFVHAKMMKNFGYDRLASIVRKESIDEMKHADKLIERILYLEGLPNLQRLGKVAVGETVPEMIKNDHALEAVAIPMLNRGISMCRDASDYGSQELLREILTSEEAHMDWLETQLELMRQLGETHYLAQQLRE